MHGKGGAFLASVAALSILTITSRHRAHLQNASLILHHSRSAARLVPAPSHHQLSNREHGTRVTVQGLFGNMPVRVKHRAVDTLNGEDEKKLDAVHRRIVGLLLAWHRNVSVTVKESHSTKILKLRSKNDVGSGEARASKSPQKFNLSFVCNILSSANLIDPSDWDDWIKTSARTPFVTIRSAISLRPAPSKQIQFMSLGIHSITTEGRGNVLYDEVNHIFALSSFGNHEELSDAAARTTPKHSKDRRFKQEGMTNKQLKGGGKGVDRWPMFYIRIESCCQVSDNREDLDGLRESTLSSIIKVLGAMITGFLEENHFRPRARSRKLRSNLSPSSPSLAKQVSDASAITTKPTRPSFDARESDDDFSTWSRIKSGSRVLRQAVTSPICETSLQEEQVAKSDLGAESACPEVLSEPDATSVTTDTITSTNDDTEGVIEWRNPISGAIIIINARTGSVLAPHVLQRPATAPALSSMSASTSINSDYTNIVFKPDTRLTRSVSSPFRTPKEGSWSSELLKKWENPVFDTTEINIPQASFDGPSIETCDILHGRRHCCTDVDIQKAFTQSSSSFATKFSKDALHQARVISQVDQKFILISLREKSDAHNDRDSQIMVLVDQHAADERVRVERLLAELTSDATSLTKPIIFELSAREHEILARHAAWFASWNIIYDVTEIAQSQICRLTVKALPAGIAERCRIEPRVLIDLLRGEAWKREESGFKNIGLRAPKLTPSTLSENGDTDVENLKSEEWLARLGTCPQGLLDMLNSRACRSAIMFNDKLSLEECRILISRLGDCAFPFQCAHGRPSMIPLVDLGSSMSNTLPLNAFGARLKESSVEETGYAEAWKRWAPQAMEKAKSL